MGLGKSTDSNFIIAKGVASNNGSKATPVLQADLFGDWREEVVWRSLDNRELKLYNDRFNGTSFIYFDA